MHCLKYGLTRAQRAARARLHRSTASRSSSAREALDAPGYDLLALAIGSEGMLVVVTEVTVKLLPKPQSARVIMASFDDVEKRRRTRSPT